MTLFACILRVFIVATAVCAAAAVEGGFCDRAPDRAGPSLASHASFETLRRHCDLKSSNRSSNTCSTSVIGEHVPVLCVGTFALTSGAQPLDLLYMRDSSPSWLWVAVKYVAADRASSAPEASPGHSLSFNYFLQQPALRSVAHPAADIFMREDESLVEAVMSSNSAFQAVRKNILAGDPWFKDTHGDRGLLGDWMVPLHALAHVPDAHPLRASDSCSYSGCPNSPDWTSVECSLWSRVFMSCYNGSASHAQLQTNWRLRGSDFFTTAKAHSIWFKLPAATLVNPSAIGASAAARQGFQDGMRGAGAMRALALKHGDVVQALRGLRIMMVGDSNMRFQYLDLAYFVCFGVWPYLSNDPESMEWLWRVHYLWDHEHAYSQTWHENFLMSTAAFKGLQQCDCFRPSKDNPNWKRASFESRVTRCNGVELEYHQFFGPSTSLSGRLPLHAPSFATHNSSDFKMEHVCGSSSSISSSSHPCLGDGRVLWGGDVMDCAPPGATAFDVLPPCSEPWSMGLLQFLADVGGAGGGVDVLLLNYGAHSSGESNASFVREVLAAGAAAVAPRGGSAIWKASYIVNPATLEDRNEALPDESLDLFMSELARMRSSTDAAEAATARRWGVLDGAALTCLLTRNGFVDKFHVKNWVTGNVNAALLRLLMHCARK